MRWFILAVIVVIGCGGCKGAATKTENINGYNVEQLFTVDDCTVYRFDDGGHTHYFVTRTGETTRKVSDGENSYHYETIPTR